MRLAQGESISTLLELKGAFGQTTLTVGQSSSCNWIVRDEGVAPVHFSLHWDGHTLRIADVYGAGGVRVDGEAVGAQWRVLSGRVRIEFGKAAVVVETGAGVPADARKDPTPLPPIGADPRRAPSNPAPGTTPAQARPNKATLLGVAPIDVGITPQTRAPASAPPAQESTAEARIQAREAALDDATFRPKRASDSERSPKPTLMGLASFPPAPEATSGASAPATVRAQVGAPLNAPVSGVTLLGVGISGGAATADVKRAGGSSLADDDQRTVQGFPAVSGSGPRTPVRDDSRTTQREVVGEGAQDGRDPRQAGAEKLASTWHELPPSHPGAVPQAVLTGHERAPSGAPGPYAHPGPSPQVGPPASAYRESGRPSRASRAPQPAAPKRRFPIQYVGVGLLTLVAYFAWLYLLDHL